MPDETSKITEIEHAPDFKQIYCNHSRLGMTQFDLVLTCGHIGEKAPNNPVIIEDISIRFSPQQFKVLVVSLAAAMAAWETQFGSVEIRRRSPDEIKSALKESVDKLKKEQGL